ncbi:MAG: NAD(P)H-dependent glycerol-3-phosphate dehydrogenase [Bacteroidetes bacterium]|nr:MAG: NAD(P)H-dependent glycerol-3-phosphate dehydrogenase [Bacteroidota bacterium]
MKVAVVGGGSWATAIIKILSDKYHDNGVKLIWWLRNPENIEYIKKHRHNPNYINSVTVPTEKIELSSDFEWVINEADIIITAIPSAFVYDAFKDLPKTALKGKIMVSAVKGVVPQTHQVLNDYFRQQFDIPEKKIVVIAGPCHAEEVALEKLSYLTIAGASKKNAQLLADMLSVRYIKTTVSKDIVGVEYASILKNIYAIAAGICHGLGYGDNFQAVLITNAMEEMKNFLDHVGNRDRHIEQSPYLGDLLVTAYSQFSRNRTFGNMIGKGYSVKTAQLEMSMVAEGYYATLSMYEICKELDYKMPLLNTIYRILYEKKAAGPEMRKLAESFI